MESYLDAVSCGIFSDDHDNDYYRLISGWSWKMVEKTAGGGCTADEFLTGDSDLLVYMEMDDDNNYNCDAMLVEELENDQTWPRSSW